MQTQQLKFTKLDKLPVPKSQSETLFIKENDGKIYSISADLGHNGLCFDAEFDYNYTYCHLKVTAATEPTFKVGDRVEWDDYTAEIVAINYDTQMAAIQYKEPIVCVGFDIRVHTTETEFVPLTDLTLITE